MAKIELFGEDAAPQGTRVHWREDIYATIRPVPYTVDERINRELNRGVKAAQLAQQPAERVGQRGVAFTQKRAAYALLDTEGMEIETASPEIVDALREALAAAVDVGKAVVLDGHWTDAVKAAVFRYLPRFAAWISNEADRLARDEAQEEIELGKTSPSMGPGGSPPPRG